MNSMKIVATGAYLPSRRVSSRDVDALLSAPEGTAERLSGVRERRWVQDPLEESNSVMGARALMGALENAHLRFEDLDALIYASGSIEQSLPCTSALVQRALGKLDSRVASFDLNSTCLSFVTAFDIASSLIEVRRYSRIGIVTSEIASVGINFDHQESAALFGDGAVAAIVERTLPEESSHVFFARMETYARGANLCQIEGGGSRLHPKLHWKPGNEGIYLFRMEGRTIFRLVMETIPDFFARALHEMKLGIDDFKLIIPHQASAMGMELVRRKLDIPPEKFLDILADYGNMIAASIPLGLHLAIERGLIARGDRVLLLGTSAGMSLGIVGFEY